MRVNGARRSPVSPMLGRDYGRSNLGFFVRIAVVTSQPEQLLLSGNGAGFPTSCSANAFHLVAGRLRRSTARFRDGIFKSKLMCMPSKPSGAWRASASETFAPQSPPCAT